MEDLSRSPFCLLDQSRIPPLPLTAQRAERKQRGRPGRRAPEPIGLPPASPARLRLRAREPPGDPLRPGHPGPAARARLGRPVAGPEAALPAPWAARARLSLQRCLDTTGPGRPSFQPRPPSGLFPGATFGTASAPGTSRALFPPPSSRPRRHELPHPSERRPRGEAAARPTRVRGPRAPTSRPDFRRWRSSGVAAASSSGWRRSRAPRSYRGDTSAAAEPLAARAEPPQEAGQSPGRRGGRRGLGEEPAQALWPCRLVPRAQALSSDPGRTAS